MKSLFSCLLLCLLIFSTIGMMTMLHVQRKAIKRQVKQEILAGIDKSRLSLLKFSKAEQQQVHFEHAREFEYQGDMYDIVMEEITQDSVWYWCWKDDAETALNRQLSALLTNTFTHNKPLQQHTENILHFYKNLFFQAHSVFIFTPTTPVGESFQFSFYRTWEDMFALIPPFSPPKFCV